MNDTDFSFHELFQRFFETDKKISLEQSARLQQSWDEVDVFWQSYWDEHQRQASFKSVLFENYDFYHDALVRHFTDEDTIAFRSYESFSGWQDLSYKELAKSSAILADSWAEQGLSAEMSVCLVLPFGREFVIYLMAAFKLGLQISWLPPDAETFLKHRLESLAPEFVLCPHDQIPFLQKLPYTLISPKKVTSPTVSLTSISYPKNSVILNLFDPVSNEYDQALELQAEFTFLQSLRDGQLFMNLKSGMTFTAAGSNSLLSEPLQLLAVLLNGACFVHVDFEFWKNSARDFTELDCDVIALSRSFRNLILDTQHKLVNCKLWFYNLRLTSIANEWQDFLDLQQDKKRSCGSIYYAAGNGGATLYSCKSSLILSPYVQPVPGIPWNSEHTLISGISSNTALSTMTHSDENLRAPKLPAITLFKQPERWYYADTMPRCYDGVYLSNEEVLTIVSEIVEDCPATIIQLPKNWDSTHARVLLVFSSSTSPEVDGYALESQLMKEIPKQLGSLFALERVEYFPFAPPLDGTEIDHRKTKSQYHLGLLHKKRTLPFFAELNKLKKKIVGL